MSGIRGKDTDPEIAVRKALHAAGLRFRLHYKNLPGKPDIVLPRHRTAIFVHGCYWHRHPGCRLTSTPSTRADFWLAKFAGNVTRDREVQRRLKELGWKVHIVWECETRDADCLQRSIKTITAILLPEPRKS